MIVRRDRLVVVTALTAVIALAWVYLLAGAGMGMSAVEMTRLSQSGMAGGMAPTVPEYPSVFDPDSETAARSGLRSNAEIGELS